MNRAKAISGLRACPRVPFIDQRDDWTKSRQLPTRMFEATI